MYCDAFQHIHVDTRVTNIYRSMTPRRTLSLDAGLYQALSRPEIIEFRTLLSLSRLYTCTDVRSAKCKSVFLVLPNVYALYNK